MKRASKVKTITRGLDRLLREGQLVGYNAAMRAMSLRPAGEATAAFSFGTRVRFQIMPIRGGGGILFHRDHDALDQLMGRYRLSQRQIDVWMNALKARRDWCAANGSTMRFLVIPEKHVVYEDKLPWPVRLSAQRPAMQLLAAADPDLARTILYPAEPLRRARSTRQTFYKTDTHWNPYGAFVAYRALVDSLARDIALETAIENELVWKEKAFIGDLGVRYEPERGETVAVAEPVATYSMVFHNRNFGRGAIHVYESDRRDLPTCVLFRDSFSNFLIPYLMRSFSRLVCVSSLSCHYDLLDAEKPDVVLFAVIERFLATFGQGRQILLPEDDSEVSFESFSGTPLKRLDAKATSLIGLGQARDKNRKVLQNYVASMPSSQNAIDAVPGWIGAMPPETGLTAGEAHLYADTRIVWLIRDCFAVPGQAVLELGPLEGAHTGIFHRAGAASIDAVEANALAFIRCLVTKEVLGLDRARFHLGDFMQWLEHGEQRYDLVVACGVLYHSHDPVRMLELIAGKADAIFIWTHYFDDAAMPTGDLRRVPFTEEVEIRQWHGVEVHMHPRSYQEAWVDSAFCGGIRDRHFWLDRDDILKLLAAFGFDHVVVADDEPRHQNGPCFSIFAERTVARKTPKGTSVRATP